MAENRWEYSRIIPGKKKKDFSLQYPLIFKKTQADPKIGG